MFRNTWHILRYDDKEFQPQKLESHIRCVYFNIPVPVLNHCKCLEKLYRFLCRMVID